LRGFEAELECGLIGGQAKVGEQVADLLLGGVEDLAGGGGVDGGGDVMAKLLELTAQLVEQILGRKLRLVGHGGLANGVEWTGGHNGAHLTSSVEVMTSRIICHTASFKKVLLFSPWCPDPSEARIRAR